MENVLQNEKKTNVIPIHKVGNKQRLKNYTLHQICLNTGFLRPVFSRIFSTILSYESEKTRLWHILRRDRPILLLTVAEIILSNNYITTCLSFFIDNNLI